MSSNAHHLPGPGLIRAAGWAALFAGLALTVIGLATRQAPGPEAWLALDFWSRAAVCLLAAGLALAAHYRLPGQPGRARALSGWTAFILVALVVISLTDEDGLATFMLVTPAAVLATLAALGADWPPANP